MRVERESGAASFPAPDIVLSLFQLHRLKRRKKASDSFGHPFERVVV